MVTYLELERLIAGMPVVKLQKESKVHVISRVENGMSRLRPDEKMRIADVLGISDARAVNLDKEVDIDRLIAFLSQSNGYQPQLPLETGEEQEEA